MHARNPVIAFALLLVSACAAGPSPYPATVAALSEGAPAPVYLEEIRTPIERNPAVVCKYVARPGSRIQERVCRTREQLASDHANAVSALRGMNGGGMSYVLESNY